LTGAPERKPLVKHHEIICLDDAHRIFDPEGANAARPKVALSPGVVWAGVATNDGWRFTIGKGLNDDRHVYRYTAADGFEKLFSCPELTGSYLSFDGQHLYLSQWYKEQILKLDDKGNIQRQIKVGAEICGHTFVDGLIYVLRGRENKGVPNKVEEWRIARLDPREESPTVEASRGTHRAGSLPAPVAKPTAGLARCRRHSELLHSRRHAQPAANGRDHRR
jgi:hypothetical protein